MASYLLSLDNTRNENQEKLATIRPNTKFSFSANFADSEKLKITTWLPESKDGESATIEFPKLNQHLRFDVKPEEAIDYFSRKQILTKKEFNALTRQAKAGAFYVAGVYKEDVLNAFHQEIQDALESGQSRQQTVKGFKEILEGAGHKELGNFHLETVFRANMQTSYGVGRRRAMEEVAEDLPFWEYVAVNDDRTRPTHKALDGIVYPANHEFWDEHYPPWDFNCRCSVIASFDYPAGYNHSRPNKDTHIAYDEKGLPAKAEYLNQVVDLKATNFVGIPKISDLEKFFKDAADRAKQSRQSRERDAYKTPQSVIDKAKEIRNEKVEVAHLFDSNGNHLISGRGNEDEYEIDLDDNLTARFEGGIDVHNHPKSGSRNYESFSLSDVQNMIDWNLKESLVVTQKYLYSMRPPNTGWNDSLKDKITESFRKNDAEILKDFYERFTSGELTLNQIKDEVRHNVWKNIAKEFGLRYKRRKI